MTLDTGMTTQRQEAAGVFAGYTAGQMDAVEEKESPRPEEPEIMFQRDESVWQRREHFGW
jgi:hypothetical protein